MDDRRLQQIVTPFYLEMMRLNALNSDPGLLQRVAKAGRSVPHPEVVALLRDAWRPRVMGAWFSLFQDPVEIREELLTSLETSAGSLTSPPLATAAVLVAGVDAVASLERYAAIDVASEWGAAGFAAAAAEHLGASLHAARSTDEDRADFSSLIAVAEELRLS